MGVRPSTKDFEDGEGRASTERRSSYYRMNKSQFSAREHQSTTCCPSFVSALSQNGCIVAFAATYQNKRGVHGVMCVRHVTIAYFLMVSTCKYMHAIASFFKVQYIEQKKNTRSSMIKYNQCQLHHHAGRRAQWQDFNNRFVKLAARPHYEAEFGSFNIA